jgi:ribulose-bisphosphate carboxylase large chain
MRLPSVAVNLSGKRFFVTYSIAASTIEDAKKRAVDLALEQTVEFPADLTPAGDITDHIVGQIESIEAQNEKFLVRISYAEETVGTETTQFLNVVFGNSSIQPGIRVEEFELTESMKALRGPRFGRKGLRNYLNAPSRPMLCTAIKPMGYGPKELAKLAHQFALGGIDIIKDDHGLADQNFSTYYERLERCADAVAEANIITGFKSIFMPNVSTHAGLILERAQFAKQKGAGGLLVCPGLVGWDTMRMLADDDALGLPIMSHPALIGSFTTSKDSGMSHYAVYGQMARLFGADATVFPSWGGRFSFSKEECASIVRGTEVEQGQMATIFPTPGGGMTMEKIPDMRSVYGNEVIYLIGGGLHRHSDDLVANCHYFRELVEGMA